MTTEFPEKSFVLAKVKGYPEWPALVVCTDDIPTAMADKKPKTRTDSICVKFYFDDKYLWCNSSNLKLIDKQFIREFLVESGEEVPAGEEDFVDNQAGRRKRIVSAYLKAYTLPIDEFIKWGSWGEPKEPELDDLEDIDEFEESDHFEEDEDDDKPKRSGKGRGRPKRSEATTAKPRGRKRKAEEPSASTTKPSKRGRKKKLPIADIPIIDNEEDEDFVEGEEDFEDEEVIDSDAEDEDEDEDTPLANIDKDWGVIEQENKSSINFKLIPDSKILADEVSSMTGWCWSIRCEIQEMLFPEGSTKLKDVKREQLALDVKRRLKEEAEKQKLPPSASIETEIKQEQEQEPVEEQEQEELQLPSLNYKAIKKSLDAIILQIVESDISKSVLRSSGLNKILLVVLKTPELQSANTPKLKKWWSSTYGYDVAVDNRWSPSFTNKMHEFEEATRREIEEEKRRKRKEERRSTPTAATTENSVAV